jgi:hypothetical protein
MSNLLGNLAEGLYAIALYYAIKKATIPWPG